jgi:hypothetical protein
MEQHKVGTPRIAFSDGALARARADFDHAELPLNEFIKDRSNGPFVHVLGLALAFLGRGAT